MLVIINIFISFTHFFTHMFSKDDSMKGDTNAIICDTIVGLCSPSADFNFVYGNCRACEGYVESGDQPPLKQVRTVLQPFYNKLTNHPIFTHPSFIEIPLSIV